MIADSTITCPECGHKAIERMPTDACQFFFECKGCAERAIAVVQYLASKSIAPENLLVAGFGEFQPIDTAKTEDGYKRNRRIEFKLTRGRL